MTDRHGRQAPALGRNGGNGMSRSVSATLPFFVIGGRAMFFHVNLLFDFN